MKVQIALTLPRDASSVPLARHTVSAALERAGVTRDCIADVKIAISEACTNAFSHATSSSVYEVMISLEDEELLIDVVDSGTGFGARPTTPSMPSPNAASGRGMALMAAFTDQAVFDSVTGGGGSVHLVKRLRWNDGAPLGHPRSPLGESFHDAP